MKERGGKPSPRGYCVRRYPFEREVSRNALNFQTASRPPSSFAWLKTMAVARNRGASAMSGSIPLPPARHRPSA